MTDLIDLSLTSPITVLMTHAPSHPMTKAAFALTQAICANLTKASPDQQAPGSGKDNDVDVKIFLYSDAVMLANRLIWLPEDVENMAKHWQQLALSLKSPIQVCVSAALARGVTNAENATRHGLDGDNLADGFELVGLGEFAMHLHHAKTVYQF